MLSIEKVVALLTPTLFAPVAALLTKIITVDVPGSHVTSGQLTALEIAAFIGAVAMGAHWLQGQKQWRKLMLDTKATADTMPAADRAALDAAAETVIAQIADEPLGPTTAPVTPLVVPVADNPAGI